MGKVTVILNAIEQGDARAANELLPAVYKELRLLAAKKLSQERPGQTLQATALVHEAYIRLVGAEAQNWSSRGHFFGAAAEAMRRILVERARKKARLKRGGAHRRVDIEGDQIPGEQKPEIILVLDEALRRLAREDPTKAELVNLRYFAGLTIREAASVMGISKATAERHWSYARAWLFHAVNNS